MSEKRRMVKISEIVKSSENQNPAALTASLLASDSIMDIEEEYPRGEKPKVWADLSYRDKNGNVVEEFREIHARLLEPVKIDPVSGEIIYATRYVMPLDEINPVMTPDEARKHLDSPEEKELVRFSNKYSNYAWMEEKQPDEVEMNRKKWTKTVYYFTAYPEAVTPPEGRVTVYYAHNEPITRVEVRKFMYFREVLPIEKIVQKVFPNEFKENEIKNRKPDDVEITEKETKEIYKLSKNKRIIVSYYHDGDEYSTAVEVQQVNEFKGEYLTTEEIRKRLGIKEELIW